MNSNNFNGIRITQRDYFALPPEMRQQMPDGGPMVLATLKGRQTFVRALIII